MHPGVHCTQTKCAVLQEIHDNLNGKGQSLNKAITLSEFGAAWYLGLGNGMFLYGLKNILISYMSTCWCQLA